MQKEAPELDNPNLNGSSFADARAVFAAVALHRLLAGFDDPEQRFSQMADAYSEVCQEAWAVANRMVELRPVPGEAGSCIS